jgi:hypothetical protein
MGRKDHIMRNLASFTAGCLTCVITVAPLAGAAEDGARDKRIGALLTGYEEVPAVSSPAEGTFRGRISADGTQIDYELTYSGLSSPVQQAHIHFAQRAVNGAIVVWLCGTAANPGPAGTPVCPAEGTVTGTITSAEVVASAPAQQIGAGELAEVIDAIEAGRAYANVHSSTSPGGEIRGQILVRSLRDLRDLLLDHLR